MQATQEQMNTLTLLWYHGVNMTPGLFDRLNIPKFEIISFVFSFQVLVNCFYSFNLNFSAALSLNFIFCLGVILTPQKNYSYR